MHRIDRFSTTLCGKPDAARAFECGWPQRWPASRRHADEEDGHRGSLPSPQHLEAGAGPQGLSLPLAQSASHPTQPGLGDGHHLHPDGAGLRLSGRRRRLVQPTRAGLRLSITLEAAFYIEAVEEALARYGKPDIFNTDQGSQFTSIDFIKTLTDADVKISTDGKGAWRDNVFVERLWRTIKYEEVNLHAFPACRGHAPRSPGI